MPGVGKLLKQAQKMQKAMENIQAELEQQIIEHSAGGGAVKVTVNGQGALKGLKLDPEFLKEDASVVEETVLAAINEAVGMAKKKSEDEMGKITGGFSIPGLI